MLLLTAIFLVALCFGSKEPPEQLKHKEAANLSDDFLSEMKARAFASLPSIIEHGDLTTLELLVQDKDFFNRFDLTHLLAKTFILNHVHLAQILIESAQDQNVLPLPFLFGNTMMLSAYFKNRPKFVELLMSFSAITGIKTFPTKQDLDEKGYPDDSDEAHMSQMAQFMVNALEGAKSPIATLMNLGKNSVVAVLIYAPTEFNVDVSANDNELLKVAAQKGHLGIVNKLIHLPSYRGVDIEKALSPAIKNDRANVIQLVLAKGVSKWVKIKYYLKVRKTGKKELIEAFRTFI